MILFINNIDMTRNLELYLYNWLFLLYQKKKTILIQIFLVKLEVDIKLLFLDSFYNESIHI